MMRPEDLVKFTQPDHNYSGKLARVMTVKVKGSRAGEQIFYGLQFGDGHSLVAEARHVRQAS